MPLGDFNQVPFFAESKKWEITKINCGAYNNRLIVNEINAVLKTCLDFKNQTKVIPICNNHTINPK
jgi:hypothetical protein